jgi:tRNA uridine 5-carboxymethylaminomethyl modification enzyme
MENVHEYYDVVVIGAGHAGVEAGLAAARLGMKTIVFTVSMDSVAMMPCNPNIGGSSKGHLVREIDALGGQMGINIDKTFIQSKMLNVSKGPAVHSLRAQADKFMYSIEMRKTLQETENLTLRQSEIAEIIVEHDHITGVRTISGAFYSCKAVIICTGVYLKARCLYGNVIEHTGPNGLKAANTLSQSFLDNGIKLRRFKTGTPARLDGKTIDYSRMEPQYGDVPVVPFSFTTDPSSVQKEQVKCYLTYTNKKTHDIIRAHLDESPIYGGIIEGIGPRYCPSIEDKVVKFADKDRHQVFIEPEGLVTHEMYVDGMSSSMPEYVQYEMYHSVAGLEHASIVRNAYAIEYDCLSPGQLLPTLELKNIQGLFSAGQFNGSSGYEEAAAQGIIAGINASMEIMGKDPLVLRRDQAYIGVLIDDLVNKESFEPYRMMTSRAEYRLLLRQDNADLRLTPIGHEIGLIDDKRYEYVRLKQKLINDEIKRVSSVYFNPDSRVQNFLNTHGSTELKKSMSFTDLVRRPELTYDMVRSLDENVPSLSDDVREQVNIQLKYQGYIEREMKQVSDFRKLEAKKIPNEIDYDLVPSLRIEARQKLNNIRPLTVGQASRISGVSPSDISVLLIYLKSGKLNDNR